MIVLVRTLLCIICLMVGISLTGCSMHNGKLLKSTSLAQASSLDLINPILGSEDHIPYKFDIIPLITSGDNEPNTRSYVRKLLVKLDNGETRIVILEDNNVEAEATNILTQ